MHKYRKLAQLAYAVMVVATIWFLNPAAAEAGNDHKPTTSALTYSHPLTVNFG